MNRKHNPLVALTALILLATILVLACTGCTTAEPAETETETEPRFTWETGTTDHKTNYTYIITDNETGTRYLYVHHASGGGGLTVLQEGEGAGNG